MYNIYTGDIDMSQAILLEKDGECKITYVGFALSIWVAGFFVPPYRKEWKQALLLFFLSIITLGLSNIYYAFKYNKKMLMKYLAQGYTVKLEPYSEGLLRYYQIPYIHQGEHHG